MVQGWPGRVRWLTWVPLSYCCCKCAAQIPAHPEYPSGHTFTVGAIQEVLLKTLGKDDVSDERRR
jgi:hypothetical protein